MAKSRSEPLVAEVMKSVEIKIIKRECFSLFFLILNSSVEEFLKELEALSNDLDMKVRRLSLVTCAHLKITQEKKGVWD